MTFLSPKRRRLSLKFGINRLNPGPSGLLTFQYRDGLFDICDIGLQHLHAPRHDGARKRGFDGNRLGLPEPERLLGRGQLHPQLGQQFRGIRHGRIPPARQAAVNRPKTMARPEIREQ